VPAGEEEEEEGEEEGAPEPIMLLPAIRFGGKVGA